MINPNPVREKALCRFLEHHGFPPLQTLVAVAGALPMTTRQVQEEIKHEGWSRLQGADFGLEVWVGDHVVHAFFMGENLLDVADM